MLRNHLPDAPRPSPWLSRGDWLLRRLLGFTLTLPSADWTGFCAPLNFQSDPIPAKLSCSVRGKCWGQTLSPVLMRSFSQHMAVIFYPVFHSDERPREGVSDRAAAPSQPAATTTKRLHLLIYYLLWMGVSSKPLTPLLEADLCSRGLIVYQTSDAQQSCQDQAWEASNIKSHDRPCEWQIRQPIRFRAHTRLPYKHDNSGLVKASCSAASTAW